MKSQEIDDKSKVNKDRGSRQHASTNDKDN